MKACGSRNGSLIQARELEFSYVPGRSVVRRASLDVPRGSMAALIGANGSGKSTLIRLLAGLLRPQGGTILYCGAPLDSIPKRDLARQIGYVPQITSAVFPFTALEVVLTGRSPYTPRFRFENETDCAKAREALDRVGALHLASRRITELSGGERQMVSVARALAQEPACLLLDEPSTSLDLKHRAGLLRTLKSLKEGAGLTCLVVTHDLTLIDPAFDWVFAVRCGEIIAEGEPSDVLRDAILAEVYDDTHVHATRLDGKTFVWSES